MSQIYIYLAKKDKKSIKPIASFRSNIQCFPTQIKLEDLDKSQLPPNIKETILFEINKNKLIYDVYIESSSSYDELRESLLKRGYKNIPLQQINLRLNRDTQINQDMLITTKSTMLRRNSDQARRT